MLHADLVEGTHDGTLEQAPHAFDAVRVDIAHDPFVEVVLHGVMLDAHTVPEATVGRKLVGVDGEGFIGDGALDEVVQGGPFRVRDALQADAPVTLHGTHDDGLVGRRVGSSALASLATTDKRLVHFDDPEQRRSLEAVGSHGLTDAVTEVPSGLVGDSEGALHLVRADPLLRLDHQVHGHEPLPQRKLGVVEDRPRGHREAVAASVAIELVPSGDLGYGHVTATRAGDTRRPAQLFEVFPAGLFGSEAIHQRHQIDIGGARHG